MLRVATLEVWRLFTPSEKNFRKPQLWSKGQALGTANMPAKWTNRLNSQELLARRKEATSDRFKEDGEVAKFPLNLKRVRVENQPLFKSRLDKAMRPQTVTVWRQGKVGTRLVIILYLVSVESNPFYSIIVTF